MITLCKTFFMMLCIYLGGYNYVSAFGKDDIIPKGNSIVPAGGLSSGTGFLDGIAEFVKDSIFGLLVLIVIGMFIYIGAQLIVARGNPEAFGKAIKSLIYVIIGLFVVSVAWLAVRLISGININ